MKLKKQSWADVTLADYEKITDIINDEGLSDAEKDVALISILCDEPEGKIWNLPLEEITELRMSILFLQKGFEYKNINFKKIKFDGWTCKVEPDLNKLSYAQFVDFQTIVKTLDSMNTPKDKAALLACFFIPEGKKYNEDYDVVALQKSIRNNISIEVYNSIWFFFLQKSRKSLKHSAAYSAGLMKARAMLMKRTNPQKKKYMEAAEKIKEVADLFG